MEDQQLTTLFKSQFEEYFKGFFDSVKFIENTHPEIGKAIAIIAIRAPNTFDWGYNADFLRQEIKDGSYFHFLENIKGEVIRSEEFILLEHQKDSGFTIR